MTETLKNTLHERAETAGLAPIDLDAVRRGGERSLRRRRAGLAAGGAVAAGVGVGVVALLGAGPWDDATSQTTPVATDPQTASPRDSSTARVTWVEGRTLHRVGAGDVDLGRAPVAYTRTSVGYVFADAGGTVYSVVDDAVEEVGVTDPDEIRLLADPTGPRAVWLDPEGTGVTTFDQATGADLTLLDRFTDDAAALTALDGDTAYVEAGSETRRIDLVTGETVVVPVRGEVLDAVGGALAVGADQGIVLVRDGVTTPLRESYGDVGVFSPDGAWFSSDADEPQVVSTTDGRPVTGFDVPAFFATGYEWLDDTTLVMVSQESSTSDVILLTCSVPAGTCERAADLGPAETLDERGVMPAYGLAMDY